MLIKICGMKEPGNVKEVAALHPDMLGFIFYKASPRYAGDLSPRALERLPAAIGKVGVFVNAETGFIENIVRRYKMDTIQLHGDEPPEMGDFQRTLPYESACQLFLFDTRSRQFGGTGKSFDWNLLNRYEGSVPFFLSGGIAWENREEIGKIKHPKLAGLDLNSRFETAPGMKNIHLLSRFLAELP